MTETENTGSATIISAMRYRDAPKAIDFLCDAFGFSRHLVVPGEGGIIEHAQLTFGNGMIMLGSARGDDFGKTMTQPDTGTATNTQSCYIIVDDVDGHCKRARAAGAEITSEPEDQHYGGRLYSCRDPEGHVWSFGSYNPWVADHG